MNEELAIRARGLLSSYIEARWELPMSARTPRELPQQVDAPLTHAFSQLEHARFNAQPTSSHVRAAVQRVQTYLKDVAA